MKAQKAKKSHSNASTKNEPQSRVQYRATKKRAAKISRELNENWQHIENSPRYLRAVRKEIQTTVGEVIEAEFMDGIFIRLKARNQGKSYPKKQRLLRRIVEKRQAQALKRKFTHANVGFVEAAISSNIRQCMAHIERLRHAG